MHTLRQTKAKACIHAHVYANTATCIHKTKTHVQQTHVKTPTHAYTKHTSIC